MKRKIQWIDEYSLGIKEIDDQHKVLFEIIDELYQSIFQMKSNEILLDILNKLDIYADYHFGTEEKYFQKFGYEGTTEHINQHKNFIEQVNLFNYKLDNNKDENLDIKIVDFLEDWIVGHIGDEDRKYIDCFLENGLK